MKISPLFYVLAVLEVLALVYLKVDEAGSGAGAFAIAVAAVFVIAAGFNRWHNGSWFTDFSGGK